MDNTTNYTAPSLYVGTYRKYNNGSLFGRWIKLSDYANAKEFFLACANLHIDERDPEYMFQDCEGIPDCLYSESMGEKDLNEVYLYMAKSAPDGALDAFLEMDNYGDMTKNIQVFNDSYIGKYKSEIDFIYELVESSDFFISSNRIMQENFDYELYCRSEFINTYNFNAGHVFLIP